MHSVFRLWEEAGVPRENKHSHRENMQTQHSKRGIQVLKIHKWMQEKGSQTQKKQCYQCKCTWNKVVFKSVVPKMLMHSPNLVLRNFTVAPLRQSQLRKLRRNLFLFLMMNCSSQLKEREGRDSFWLKQEQTVNLKAAEFAVKGIFKTIFTRICYVCVCAGWNLNSRYLPQVGLIYVSKWHL